MREFVGNDPHQLRRNREAIANAGLVPHGLLIESEGLLVLALLIKMLGELNQIIVNKQVAGVFQFP